MIVSIIIFVMVLVIDLFTDLRLFKKGKPVNHKVGAALRLAGFIPIYFLLGWQIIPFAGFLYWLLFDGLYNVFRGFGWWFTGSDDKDDANTDNFLQHLSKWQHITLKIAGLIGSLLLYLLI